MNARPGRPDVRWRAATASLWLPRHLHPGAWWLWALGLATAASRTTNPLLLLLLIAVAGLVVAARRTDAPWSRSYSVFLRLGVVVILLRVLLNALFGAPVPNGTVLFTLPELSLPDWAAGVRIGGHVTLEGLVAAAYDGLRLATLLVCVGAANALANPSRLLRSVPGALYELGVAVVVAMTFAPQVVMSVGRVRGARRLRGRPDKGIRGLRGVAMPVLEGALERSLELAAAMDSRGYGRRAGVSRGARRFTATLVVAGLLGVCAGVYGLLDGGSPPLLGVPVLAAGLAAAALGFALGGRRTTRSRYRPDPWAVPEWIVSTSGLTAAAVLVVAAAMGEPALTPPIIPLDWPTLPVLPALGILVGLLPAWAAPVPPKPRTPTADRRRAEPARARVAA